MTDASEVQLCVFRVGAQDYALDGRRVEEMLGPLPFQVPLAWRGTAVPVADLRLLLGLGTARIADESTRYILCRIGRRRVALAVDHLQRVVRASVDAIRPGPYAPFVIGAWESVHLLDVLALLRAHSPGGAP